MSDIPARELRLKRDEAVKKRYQELCEQHPLERDDTIYSLLQNEFFLEHRTLGAILSGEYERNLQRKMGHGAADPAQYSLFPEPNETTQSYDEPRG